MREAQTSRLRARALEDEDEHMHAHGKRAVRTVAAKEPTKKKTWVRVVRVVGEVRRRGPRPGWMEGMAGSHAMRPRHLRSGVEARMVGGGW